jgi:ABC-type antimicrobial peptide transport system permease subunit
MRAIRAAVLDVNPKLAIFGIRTMAQVVDESLWQLHLYRWLIGGFAALGVLLSAVGLYGLIAYTASARSREFAIRLALGSSHRALGRLVLSGGLKLVVAGLVLGAVCIGGLRWWLDDLPGGIEIDLATPVAVSAVLVVISALACAVPALRAATIDPITALRQE